MLFHISLCTAQNTINYFGVDTTKFKGKCFIFERDTFKTVFLNEGVYLEKGDIYLYDQRSREKKLIIENKYVILTEEFERSYYIYPKSKNQISVLKAFVYKSTLHNKEYKLITLNNNNIDTSFSFSCKTIINYSFNYKVMLDLDSIYLDLYTGCLYLKKEGYLQEAHDIQNIIGSNFKIYRSINECKQNNYGEYNCTPIFGLFSFKNEFYSPASTLVEYRLMIEVAKSSEKNILILKEALNNYIVNHPEGIPIYLRSKQMQYRSDHISFICIDKKGTMNLYNEFFDEENYNSKLYLIRQIDLKDKEAKKLKALICDLYNYSIK